MYVPGASPYAQYSFQNRLQITTANESLKASPIKEFGPHPRDFAKQLNSLSKSLKGLKLSSAFKMVPKAGAQKLLGGGVVKSADLNLGVTGSYANLRSSEEVNAIATSYGPVQPSFNGLTTTDPTIGGIYDGSNGDDTLTFVAQGTGTVGSSTLNFRILNGAGQTVQDFTVSAGYTPGDEIALANGLTFALSSGLVVSGDEFDLNVSATVGSAVDPTKAFNSTGNNAPNFEPGLGVQAGSFSINGAPINVANNDTLLSVISKINSSEAGVIATFDSQTESIVLTQQTEGSASTIALGADTSGFLDAVKLSSAILEPGEDADIDKALGDLASLQISSGTLVINGVEIAIDVAQDSLLDVIEKINAADAGVEASYNYETGMFELTSDSIFTISGGTTDFFTELGIEEGEHGALAKAGGAKQLVFKKSHGLRQGVREVGLAVKELLSDVVFSADSLESKLVRNALTDAIGKAVGDIKPDATGDKLNTGFGIEFDLSGDGTATVKIDQGKLSKALTNKSAELAEFLVGGTGAGGGKGLIAYLSKAIEQIEGSVIPLIDPGGYGGLFINKLG